MKPALELNPVFRRDSRVRWRGNRAYGVLLLLAVAVCGVVLWAYGFGRMARLAIQMPSPAPTTFRRLAMALGLIALRFWSYLTTPTHWFLA